LTLALSLRHEFSTAFHRLVHSPLDSAIPIEISDGHFPVFLRFLSSRSVAVSRALLALDVPESQTVNDLALTVNGTPITDFARNVAVSGLYAADLGGLFAQGIHATHTVTVTNAGDLAPDAPAPTDLSALDENKLRNILLYIEYNVT
jgi:hypothetical protein